jgi:signal transduction histidine kinase
MARRRLPIRVRLTLVFAGGMALVIAGVGAFVQNRMGADLLAATDVSLSAQADALIGAIQASRLVVGPGSAFGGSDEEFAQVADVSGRVLQSTAAVAEVPLLPPATLRAVSRRTYVERIVPGVDNIARLLVTPIDAPAGRFELVVGTSLQDRRDALTQLAVLLGVGGTLALALTTLAGWLLAGALLRSVEQLRREAAAISTVEPGRVMSVPAGDDEIARLGATLNDMLARLSRSQERERRFLDQASHELRTPLATLKAELDLAALRHRTPEEYRATIASAAIEADRLARLADDLLVLSRARGGRLPVHREDTGIGPLVREACDRRVARAEAAQVRIESHADGIRASIDPVRVRQALDDLLDNAVRYSRPSGTVTVRAAMGNGWLTLVVDDDGPGFPPGFLARAFEPFTRSPETADGDGAGLGLTIVQAIARSHGGSATAENRPEGGGRVTLVLPSADAG